MDLLMVRERRRLVLVPATPIDEERLRSIRVYDAPMQVQTMFARTSKLNRWYRGLVGHVADAIDANPDAAAHLAVGLAQDDEEGSHRFEEAVLRNTASSFHVDAAHVRELTDRVAGKITASGYTVLNLNAAKPENWHDTKRLARGSFGRS